MTATLRDLARCHDIESLEAALRSLCTEFGSLDRLDILTMSKNGKGQAVCFFRLASSRQEGILISKLGASRFGDDICLVVDLGMPKQES